jgi:hypothetical protein
MFAEATYYLKRGKIEDGPNKPSGIKTKDS